MPQALTYPGVYIEEKPSGVRTLTGVATSIAAFVGYTAKGVPDKAVMITSFADFERGYGGLDRDSPVSYAVRQFFTNGGTQALIVRVASGYAIASWVLQDSKPADALTVTAASPGDWGNDLRISVDSAHARNPDAEFNLLVWQVQPDGAPPKLLETHRNLSMNPRSPRFVESVLGNAGSLVTASRKAGLVFDQSGFAVSKNVAFPIKSADLAIGGVIDGARPFLLVLPAAPADIDALVTAVNQAIADAGLAALMDASKSGADGGGGTKALKLTSLTKGESSSIAIAGGSFGGLASTMRLGLANGGREFTGDAQHRPADIADAAAAAPKVKGNNGSRGGSTELLGSPLDKTGINALLDADLFNILCIPETFDMADTDASDLAGQAIAFCAAHRAFYVVDPPSGRTLADVAAWATALTSAQARNAAVYFPPVIIADPLDERRPRAMAPSGTIAGIYARTDATRGVWKAPAGIDATLDGTLDVKTAITDLENGGINQRGVNALRKFAAYGRVAWGARTMRGADSQADEYKYVPVRRMALFLEESLYRGTQWVVFEPNDEPLWASIRLNIGAFLHGLFRQGAFQGQTPRQAYFVKCDRETTTQADINLGIVNILVGFAPLKPAEFVVITIQQIAGDIPT